MFDESVNISAKTWTRTVDNINKVGYSDGVVDGQTESFQSSFDMGYAQGLDFGFKIGYKLAHQQDTQQNHPTDPRCINCQICLNGQPSSDNVVNLYNTQKEKNDTYLEK